MTEEATNFLGFAYAIRGGFTKTVAENNGSALTGMDDLLFANECVVATLGSIMSRHGSVSLLNITDDQRKRGNIHAACFQTMMTFEFCLTSALYIQAATLVRQEIEAVETLRSIRVGRYRDGSKSNSTLHTLRHLGRVYGDLTDTAHLQRDKIIKHLTASGSLDPVHNAEYATWLGGIHIHVSIGLALDLADLIEPAYGFLLTPDEEHHIGLANAVLLKRGVVTLKETETPAS